MPTAPIAEQHEHYDAFISYSHAADGSLAPALQHGLQTLAKPLYQRKALQVFRDQTNLAATPELWSTIEQALTSSRFFILLASPAAAKSPWVQQELDWWRCHRAPERLLISVTHGAIAWDAAAGDFDWHTTDALPLSLSRWFPAEPLWVDLRWTNSKSALSHRDPRLQEDIAALAAPLRGMSKDNLIGRDLRQHHKVVRLTVAAISLLLVLTVAAGAGAWVATQQRNTAQRQTALAESRALASAARSTASTQLDLALLLAQRSVQMNATPDTLASLFWAVSASPQLVQFMQQRSQVTTLIARPGGGMIVGDAQGDVLLLDTAHARQQSLPAASTRAVTALAESGPGKIVVSGDAAGTVRLWPLQSRSLRWQRALRSPVQAIAVSPDASTIAAVLRNNTLVDLDAINGRVRSRVLSASADLSRPDHVGFLKKDIVLIGDNLGETEVWRTAPQPHRLSESPRVTPADRPAAAAWSDDGRTYVFAVAQTYVFAVGGSAGLRAATGQAHGSFDPLPASTSTVAIDDSTNRLAYISDGVLAVQDRSARASKAGRSSMQLPGFANAQQIAFTADGRWLIASGGDTLAIFNLLQRSRLATELPTEVAPLVCQACITGATVDPRGHLVVWTDGADIICYDVRRARRNRYPNANLPTLGNVAFTPDGGTLLSFSESSAGAGRVGIWPTSAGCPSSVRWIGTGDYTDDQLLPVDKNHAIINSYSLGSIALLDLRRGKIVHIYSLPDRKTAPISVAVSSDARSMAVSLNTGKIVWFNISSGAVVGTNGSESVGYSYSDIIFLPGSQNVAQTTPTAVVVWDPHRGQVGRFEGSAQQLALSHDGQLLFGLDDQETLRIWDRAHQTLIGSLQALPLIDDNGNPVAGGSDYGTRTSMTLDDNNNLWLIAPSAHPTRWMLSPPIWSRAACAWAARSLTPTEWQKYIGTSPPADLSCHR